VKIVLTTHTIISQDREMLYSRIFFINCFRIILFLYFFLFHTNLFCQTDYEFWFAAPAITTQTIPPSSVIVTQLNQPICLYITTAEGPAIVKIEQPANSSFIPIVITVTNDSAKAVNLTPFLNIIENKPADTILNYGVKITSDKRISAIYEIQSPENAATYTLYGKNALGYEFIIPSQKHFSNFPFCDPAARNVFDIVATDDSTLVQIIPSKDIVGHIANDTFSVVLNRGQTWSGKAVSGDSTDHIGGTMVFSNKPIAVTVTDDMVFIPNTEPNAFDVAGDQILPRNIAGNDFIIREPYELIPFHSRIMVYAYEDSTAITYNDSINIQSLIIDRGESAEFIFPSYGSLPYGNVAYIHANNHILLSEFTGAPGINSPQASFCMISPIVCGLSKRVTFTQTPPSGNLFQFKFFLFTKNGNQGNFTYKPSWIAIPPSAFNPVPGTFGEWVSAESGGYGNFPMYLTVQIENPESFQLSAISWDFGATNAHFSKYTYFSDFSSLNLGPDIAICPGDSVLLDAGYGRSSYLWSTGETSHTIWVYSPGTYWVNTTEPDCNLSDTILISYYPLIPINLGPDQIICIGDSIQLDAGTGRNWYLWSTGDTTQTIWVQNSGLYWVSVPDGDCILSDTNEISQTPTPFITNVPLVKSICSGEVTNIPLTSNLSGTNFLWTATGSSPLISGYGPGTGDTIDQVLTNTGPISETVTYTIIPSLGDCEGDSVEYVVTVTPGDSVLVSISASNDSICQGIQLSYVATPTYGGSAPGYQWKVNGFNQGTNNSVFNYTPSNHDTVCCILTSSDTVCISNNPATSNEIIMTVYPDLPVIISISTTNNPVCEGSTAIFSASTSNKGASPDFQWIVNGNPVGTNDSSYTYTPSNGDQVYCILTSSEQCTSNNPAASDTITMVVNPLLPVEISISAFANPVCEGLPVTFTATPVNGGAMPAYQWQVNGINTGTNNPGFTYTPVDGDLVTCTLTSNAECVTNNPATSNSISMSVGDAPDVNLTVCFDTITTINAKPFKLKGGVPLGGTYSGPGVNQITGYFNPAMAGAGLKTISYSYTNLFNCSNNATRTISVINPTPFTCGDSLTDIRDNKKYPTIQIGSQCWLAVNLNHGQQIGGSSAQRDNCLVEKYCYNNLSSNCTQYGALYQWDELMRYEDAEEIQGLCPPRWHVPSEADWSQLFAVYQGNAFAGSPLLYTGYSGFNVLLAGVEFFNQSHRFVDFASIMWSSTSHGPYKAWSHGLNEYNYSVSYYPSYRSNAFSVRCVLD
jgi:uncharacterized protein (TIGR02145 family)